LYKDAQLFYEYAKKRYSEDQITIYGRSLGTGIAAKVASQNRPCNVVLETPYYSIKDVAQRWLPFIPVDLLLRFEIPTVEFVQNINCSITIYHGTNDKVVPYKSGALLYKSITIRDKDMITIENGSHNDLIQFKKYIMTIEQVLDNSY